MLARYTNRVTISDMTIYICLYGKGHVRLPNTDNRQGCVPCCDLQRDHDKFIEDECCERDRNDMQKLILKEHKGHNHDSST